MSEPKFATSMTWDICDDYHLHIDLMDENGGVYAGAVVDIDVVGEKILQIAAIYFDMVDEEDTIGPTIGSC